MLNSLCLSTWLFLETSKSLDSFSVRRSNSHFVWREGQLDLYIFQLLLDWSSLRGVYRWFLNAIWTSFCKKVDRCCQPGWIWAWSKIHSALKFWTSFVFQCARILTRTSACVNTLFGCGSFFLSVWFWIGLEQLSGGLQSQLTGSLIIMSATEDRVLIVSDQIIS